MRRLIAASIICAITSFISTQTMAATRHHHRHHYHHHHVARHHHHGERSIAIASRHRGLGNIGGLLPSFSAALTPLLKKTGCWVGSGYRSSSEQARLYRLKPALAARPGHSNHERRLAADLACPPGGLTKMHHLASVAGLVFPMMGGGRHHKYEPWHIEPRGATQFASKRHRVRYAAIHNFRHVYMRVRPHRHHHHAKRYAFIPKGDWGL